MSSNLTYSPRSNASIQDGCVNKPCETFAEHLLWQSTARLLLKNLLLFYLISNSVAVLLSELLHPQVFRGGLIVGKPSDLESRRWASTPILPLRELVIRTCPTGTLRRCQMITHGQHWILCPAYNKLSRNVRRYLFLLLLQASSSSNSSSRGSCCNSSKQWQNHTRLVVR